MRSIYTAAIFILMHCMNTFPSQINKFWISLCFCYDLSMSLKHWNLTFRVLNQRMTYCSINPKLENYFILCINGFGMLKVAT